MTFKVLPQALWGQHSSAVTFSDGVITCYTILHCLCNK